LNLSKTKAELLGSRPNWNMFLEIAKLNSNNFSLKKTVWFCVIMFALL
jgi:hypothetical protein